MQRYLQAWSKRDIDPEAQFWEAEAGQKWLSRLVCAGVLYELGTQGAWGEKLSRFFKRVRLENRVSDNDWFAACRIEQLPEAGIGVIR